MAADFIKRTTTPFASGNYINDVHCSSTGKWITPAAFANETQKVLVRNDSTGNYDTQIVPTGATAISGSSAAWRADDSEFVIGTQTALVIFTQTAGAFAQLFGVTLGQDVRGVDFCSSADHLASVDGSGNVRVHKRTATTTYTSLTVPSNGLGGVGEDVKFSPDGIYLAAIGRNGVTRFWKRTGDTYTFLNDITGGGNWHINWSPDGTHVIVHPGQVASKPLLIKRTADVFAYIAGAFTGGTAIVAIASGFVTAGKYLVQCGTGGVAPMVWERSGDTYASVSFTGLTNEVSYDGRASKDGTTYVNGTSSGTVVAYSAPVADNLRTITAAMELSGLTTDGRLNLNPDATAALTLEGLTTTGLITMPLGIASELVLEGLTTTGIIAGGDDIVPGFPWEIQTMWVQSGPGDLLWNERAPVNPFLYGDLSLFGLESSGLAVFPVEGDGAILLSGLTTDGRIDLPIAISGTPELPGLATDGEIMMPDGFFAAGEIVFDGLTTDGEITVPFAGEAFLTLEGLTTDGEIDVPFGATGDLELPGLTTYALLKIVFRVTGEIELPGLSFDGYGPTPIDGVSEIELPSLSAAGEVYMPLGVIGQLELPGLSTDGLVAVPWVTSEILLPGLEAAGVVYQIVVIDGALELSGLTATGELGRFNRIDANLRLPGLATDGLLVYPISINGAWELSALSAAGEIKLPLTVDAEIILPGLQMSGEMGGAARAATGPGIEYGYGYGYNIGNGMRLMYDGDIEYRIG